jgi:hypothetical protein
MDDPKIPQEYNNPNSNKLCKWDEDDMKCKNEAVKDGYCTEHSNKLAEKVAMGAITGGGVGALLANPVVLTVGALAGVALVLYLASKSK